VTSPYKAWIQLCLTLAVSTTFTACFSFSKDDGGGAPPDTDPAYANLCHGLTMDGGVAELSLTFLNDEADTAELSALSGACASDLDAGCAEIPTGDEVTVRLNLRRTTLTAAKMKIEPANEYEFYVDLDTDDLPVLHSRNLTEDNLQCNMSECNTLMYTPSTCNADDPCGWAGDGFCDDVCLDISRTPFDDSEDCATPTR